MIQYGRFKSIHSKTANFSLLLMCILSCLSFAVFAEVNEPSIERVRVISHDLDCGEVFLCPPELQPRINFWIQVYRLWSRKDRVLHDARFPSRVYGVFHDIGYCRRGEAMGELKSEFNKIKRNLNILADILETDGIDISLYQSSSIGRLFPNLSAKQLREAATHIRCQAGNRESFKSGLKQSSRYQRVITDILSQYDLPDELRYLPLVESSYDPTVYSHAGAAGIWQIMPATASTLGLKMSAAIDERLDPVKSSFAAAKYFASSFKRLTKAANESHYPSSIQDIAPFAVTSYNYGIGGMETAIAQVGTNFDQLLTNFHAKGFKVASKNFYVSFLAASHVAKKASFYFPNLKYIQSDEVEKVALTKTVSMPLLLSAINLDEGTLKALNPSLLPDVWSGQAFVPRDFELRLPKKNKENSNIVNVVEKLSRGKVRIATKELDSFHPRFEEKINYDLSVKQEGARYFIHVLPPENFDHYARWVDEVNTPNIRRFNQFATAKRLSFGTIIRLPLLNDNEVMLFEKKRERFHQKMMKQYFARFQIAAARRYSVQENEPIWQVAMQERIPIWLLLNLNPEAGVDSNVRELLIPQIEPRL